MRSIRIIIIILLGFSFFLADSHLVFAEQINSVKDCLDDPEKCSDNEVTPESNGDSEGVSGRESVGVTIWDFIKMILATILVVALIYFLLKFLGKRNRGYQATALVQNIGGTRVGANRSVQIIKVADRVLIVGVGENISLLKELDDETAQEILTEYNNQLDNMVGPGDVVSKLIQRRNEKGNKKDKSSFSLLFNKQLEEMTQKRKKAYEEMNEKGPNNDE